MGRTKKRRKGKVKVSQKVQVVAKDSIQRTDTIPSMKPQRPRSNGAVLKVKLKKKR